MSDKAKIGTKERNREPKGNMKRLQETDMKGGK